MPWRQLITPNYEINERAGMCLSYSRRSYGLPAVEPTAYAALRALKHFHADRHFPDASIPVWFEWWGDLGNGAGRIRYDHVAIRDKSGRIWSSPLSGNGRAWFATVDDLVRAFGNGMKFLGWSEDISGYRVVINEGEDMAELVNLDTARILAAAAVTRDGFDGRPDAHGGSEDGDLNKYHVGRPLTNQYIRDNWFASKEASDRFGINRAVYKERDALRTEVETLKVKLKEAVEAAKPVQSSEVTVLKPGTYEVK